MAKSVDKDIIVGGEEGDIIFGSLNADLIETGDGSDLIFSGPGDDTISAGGGDDAIFSSFGNDKVDAGDGDDLVFSGFGNDKVDAGDGDDLVFSGFGNDNVDGGDGNDAIFGGFGNDNINAGDGNDFVNGGAGNDTILGGGGVDILNGGDGDDIIDGQKGDDIMNGGAGDDRLIWNNGDGSDILDGGEGFDVSEVNDAAADGDEFVLGQNGDRALFERVNLGQFTLDADNVESFEINASGGDDSLTVNDLSDTDVEVVNFSGGEGNDSLDGSGTSTTLIADGGVGDDLLQGGEAADTLDGGEGNDTILGGGGDDTLNGGDGDDIIDGQKGDDIMNGGAGDDRLIWNNGDGSDILDGGEGFDVSEVNDAAADGDEFVLGQNGDRALFERVNLGQFTLDADNVESFEINASGGDDSLTVNDLSDTDVEVVNFSGGEGNDFLNASGTNTPIVADGGVGDDILIGGGGDDILIGGAGSDLIIGGPGNDILIGGDGADAFGFDNNAAFSLDGVGMNQIQDFQAGEDQIILDKTVFEALSSGAGEGFEIANEFAVVANDADANASEAAILFNSSTGALIYNQNGAEAGYGDGGQFAVLEGVENLTADDFAIKA
ncbi:MAG: calcium-binding protein [Cyanobacteria bacterium P01_G01_bin.49]